MNTPLFIGIKYAMIGIMVFLIALAVLQHFGMINVAAVIGAAIGCMLAVIPYSVTKAFRSGEKSSS